MRDARIRPAVFSLWSFVACGGQASAPATTARPTAIPPVTSSAVAPSPTAGPATTASASSVAPGASEVSPGSTATPRVPDAVTATPALVIVGAEKPPTPAEPGHVPVINPNGRLPSEVILRIMRQNGKLFRVCYQGGLKRNPALAGDVRVTFVIARDGSVPQAADGGSSMPDREVIECVVRTMREITFPQPEGGVINIVFPMRFTPQ